MQFVSIFLSLSLSPTFLMICSMITFRCCFSAHISFFRLFYFWFESFNEFWSNFFFVCFNILYFILLRFDAFIAIFFFSKIFYLSLFLCFHFPKQNFDGRNLILFLALSLICSNFIFFFLSFCCGFIFRTPPNKNYFSSNKVFWFLANLMLALILNYISCSTSRYIITFISKNIEFIFLECVFIFKKKKNKLFTNFKYFKQNNFSTSQMVFPNNNKYFNWVQHFFFGFDFGFGFNSIYK